MLLRPLPGDMKETKKGPQREGGGKEVAVYIFIEPTHHWHRSCSQPKGRRSTRGTIDNVFILAFIVRAVLYTDFVEYALMLNKRNLCLHP